MLNSRFKNVALFKTLHDMSKNLQYDDQSCVNSAISAATHFPCRRHLLNNNSLDLFRFTLSTATVVLANRGIGSTYEVKNGSNTFHVV